MDLTAALAAFREAFERWVLALSYGTDDIDELTDELVRCRRGVEIALLDQQFARSA